jgi:MFS family permease
MMVSVSFEVPLYAQGVLGQDALHAGLALAPMSLGWPLAGAFSGRLSLRFGYRATAVTGMLCGVVGVALLLTLDPHSSWVLASAYSFFIGVGLGLSSTPMIIAVQSAVAWSRRGVATATNMFVRSFGGVVGLAVMGAIVNHVSGHAGGSSATNQALDVSGRHSVPPSVLAHIQQSLFDGIHLAFISALIAAVLCLIVVAFLPGGSARLHALQEEQDSAPLPRAVGETRDA